MMPEMNGDTVAPNLGDVDVSLALNRQARMALTLVLDCSGSMAGAPIAELQASLPLLVNHLREDKLAAKRIEIAVVLVGGDAPQLFDFVAPDAFMLPLLVASGGTPLAEGLELALDAIDARRQAYIKSATKMYKPLLFVLSDGAPNPDPQKINAAVSRVQKSVEAKRVGVFPIAIGEQADTAFLSRLSPGGCKRLDPQKGFGPFMEFVSDVAKSVAASTVGAQVALPPTDAWSVI